MPYSYLDNQSFEEVESKLKGKIIVTPSQLESLKIFSNSSVVRYFNNKTLRGEKNGVKSYSFLVSDVLELCRKIIEKKEKAIEEEKKRILRMRKKEFPEVKNNNHILIEKLEALIKEIRENK